MENPSGGRRTEVLKARREVNPKPRMFAERLLNNGHTLNAIGGAAPKAAGISNQCRFRRFYVGHRTDEPTLKNYPQWRGFKSQLAAWQARMNTRGKFSRDREAA
jgi:hypothetical protein